VTTIKNTKKYSKKKISYSKGKGESIMKKLLREEGFENKPIEDAY